MHKQLGVGSLLDMEERTAPSLNPAKYQQIDGQFIKCHLNYIKLHLHTQILHHIVCIRSIWEG